MRKNVELLSAKELSEGIPKSDDSLRVVGHSENTNAQTNLKSPELCVILVRTVTGKLNFEDLNFGRQ